MLELLAGPYDVKVDDEAITVRDDAYWHDRFGLLLFEGAFPGRLHAVQMDGKAYIRSSHQPATFITDTESDELNIVYGVLPWQMFNFDGFSGLRGTLKSESVFSGVQVRAKDRDLSFSANNVYWSTFVAAFGVATQEAILTNYGSGAIRLSKYDKNVLAVSFASGKIVFYDYVKKTEVLIPKYLPANTGAWFSKSHGVWVVFTVASSYGTVSVYANTPKPYAVSSPSAVESFVKGLVSKVRVRVTGSNDEPCVDELVNWSIGSGPGSLTVTQSKTDANGYAEVEYVAPLALSSNPNIVASLTC